MTDFAKLAVEYDVSYDALGKANAKAHNAQERYNQAETQLLKHMQAQRKRRVVADDYLYEWETDSQGRHQLVRYGVDVVL